MSVGCLSLGCLANVVEFVAGAGVGFANVTGNPINPEIRDVVYYGPLVVGGVQGAFSGIDDGCGVGCVTTAMGAAYHEAVMGVGYVAGAGVGLVARLFS